MIVDTVAGPGAPGEVRLWEGRELAHLPRAPRISPHDPAVAEALAVVQAAGRGPRDACLVATVPGSSELGAALSEPVRAAAEVAVELVRRRLESHGVHAGRRPAGGVDPDWWHAAPASGRHGGIAVDAGA